MSLDKSLHGLEGFDDAIDDGEGGHVNIEPANVQKYYNASYNGFNSSI